jgi:predicted DNA-binding protein with PD1-like motif
MKTKWISKKPKTLAIVFDTGDEVMDGLLKAAHEFKLTASHFTAIGAFQKVTLGFFDLTKKDYRKTTINRQLEALSLIGDICLKDSKPQIHAHVVVGLPDTTTRGGHLISGVVRPTLEVILVESPIHLRRRSRPEVGLALIDLDTGS